MKSAKRKGVRRMLKNGFLFTLGAAGASLAIVAVMAATVLVLDKTGIIELVLD